MSKACSRCKETKDDAEFYARKQGLDSWCKGCYRTWHRERYQPQAGSDDSPRACAACGESYQPKQRRPSMFCSRDCKDRAREEMRQAARVCIVDGCTNPPANPGSRRKRCEEHAGIRSRYIDSNGYVRLERKVDGTREMILEHRRVMADALGRELWPFENVHHRNGRKADNRLSNLEVWVTPQPSGQRPEDLAEWVAQTYPSLVRQALVGEKPHLL